MTVQSARRRRNSAQQVVLVVDDDRRVRDLLEIAFVAHGFRVIKAADGEEALRVATEERPDLLILDVRLPRKSGLEVCQTLRRDPEEPHVPIILVSAAAETDARLRGLACGADDYVSKPFSPKELIARVRRLLERTAQISEASERSKQLQLELAKARGEVRRTHLEAEHDNRLREAVRGPGRQLQVTLDVDEIAHRLATIVQARAGLGTVAVLVADSSGRCLQPRAVRGDTFDRVAGIEFGADEEIVKIVAGLGRPVQRAELERLPELEDAMPRLVSSGFTVLAALRSSEGLEGLLVADDRTDGRALNRTERDEVTDLCDIAAVALGNARLSRKQTDRLLKVVVDPGPGLKQAPGLDARNGIDVMDETTTVILRAARAAWLPPRYVELLELGVALGAGDDSVTESLGAMVADDPTGRARDLLAIVERSHELDGPDTHMPEQQRAALLLFVARRYTAARLAGTEPEAALVEASLAAGGSLDPTTAQALNGALREPLTA